jgi:hypothetical protein
MNRVLDIKHFENKNDNSIIGFDNQGGGGWEKWNRFITINDKRIFEIGNICGTCEIYFKKLQESNPEIDETEIAGILNKGIKNIEDSILNKIMQLMPNGSYSCSLNQILPTINSVNDYFSNEQRKTWGSEKFTGSKNIPETNYYRGNDFKIKAKELFIELLIPTQNSKIDEQRVEFYIDKLRKGENSTCLCLSVLDIKAPAMWEDEIEPEFDTHWCLSNYLIDGHHKVEASSRTGIPLTMLSLININESIIEKGNQVDELLIKMKSQPITIDDDRISTRTS